MTYDTPILTRIQDGMASKIGTISKSDGYFCNWGSINEPDIAKQEFPSAEITFDNEDCLDETDSAWSNAYNQEAHFIIRVRAALANEETTPFYKINEELNKALEDLKRCFGIHYTASENACEIIMYQGAQRINDNSNDIFRPAYLDTRWLVKYTQVRTDPSRFV